MVKSCSVWNCNANTAKNSDRKFFIIPKESTRRKKWLYFINRAGLLPNGRPDYQKLWDPPSPFIYVCSAHFISGKKVNDPVDPDYVPSVQISLSNETYIKDTKLPKIRIGVAQTCADDEIVLQQQSKKLEASAGVCNHMQEDEKESAFQLTPSDNKFVQETSTELNENDALLYEIKTLRGENDAVVKERNMLRTEVVNLRKERDAAIAEVKRLQEKISSMDETISNAQQDNDKPFVVYPQFLRVSYEDCPKK